MRALPQRAIDFIKGQEAVRLTAYLDVAGVPTIGWGHTAGVKMGKGPIPLSLAEFYLKDDLANVTREISRLLKPAILARLTDQQYAALCSFGFNLGVNPEDGIWSLINSGQFDRVPSRMLLYNKARVNGKLIKVRGLTNRRQAEAALWEEGQGQEVELTAYHADTTPTPIEKPARKSATIWAVIASPFAAAFAALKDWLTPDTVHQVSGAISPFADKSSLVAGALSALAVLAAMLAAIMVLRKHNQARS